MEFDKITPEIINAIREGNAELKYLLEMDKYIETLKNLIYERIKFNKLCDDPSNEELGEYISKYIMAMFKYADERKDEIKTKLKNTIIEVVV